MPRVDKWCEFEQRWTDHATSDSHLRIAHMNNQRMRNQGVFYQPKRKFQVYNPMGVGEQNLP